MNRAAGFLLAMAIAAAGGTASAQTSAPHPLRPSASPPPASAPPVRREVAPVVPSEAHPETPPAGTKRPRSPAQRANDERMRACGREWRVRKEALRAEGWTWYRFSAECRARLKGQQV